jgi:5-methylcytosine-specific restriction endonuclease McrA
VAAHLPAVPEKKCSKCLKVKARTEFHRRNKSKDGLRPECKECRKAYQAANKESIARYNRGYKRANKETIVEYMRLYGKEYREANAGELATKRHLYYQQNKARMRRQHRAYQRANKERVSSQKRAYRAANKERINERRKEYRAANKEVIAGRDRRYREANLEQARERVRDYKKKNPDKVRAYVARRRALKVTASGAYTEAEWLALCEHHGHRCLSCGTQSRPLTADHVIPLSKGGGNTIENIQPLCGPCNSRKGANDTDYRDSKTSNAVQLPVSAF